MSLSKLKRNRTSVADLVEKAKESESSSGYQKDERFWVPKRDAAGNGYAVIRFLPAPEDEPTPWTRYWDHAFKGPTGQWYIEKSLTSIGQQDPIGELNTKMWNTEEKNQQQIVRNRKRNLRYVANILVLSDPSQPEFEGKVMLYRFGKKIFDKIMDAMKPPFPDQEAINPFDLWDGADFSLRIRKIEGFPNYDASAFKDPSELYDGDEAKLDKVYSQVYSLAEFTDPTNYKSYDELKSRLSTVLGEEARAPLTTKQKVELDDEIPYDNFSKSSKSKSEVQEDVAEDADDDDDDDDVMANFKRLANMDDD